MQLVNYTGFPIYTLLRKNYLSPTTCHQSPQFLVEGSSLHQILKRQVHAILPILVRIGRHIDLLVLRIRIPQGCIDSQPILQGQEAKHRRRLQVHGHYLFANFSLSLSRRFPSTAKHIVPKRLCLFLVLPPP
ncbi:hypothetical protein EVA_06886 [gut metagenome]|uniref:Uncharacterized protein n=1 Tax=gut metagenome TaxID=749906 RepID=J9GWJ2_9ZZZZ